MYQSFKTYNNFDPGDGLGLFRDCTLFIRGTGLEISIRGNNFFVKASIRGNNFFSKHIYGARTFLGVTSEYPYTRQ